MFVRPSGSSTLVRALHIQNAKSPIPVTVEGICTDVSPDRLSKASATINSTPSGIVTSPFTPWTSHLPSLVSKRPSMDFRVGFPLATENDSRAEQPWKAYRPTSVMVAGIVTVLSPVLPLSAYPPRYVLLLPPSEPGIVTEPVGRGETAALPSL